MRRKGWAAEVANGLGNGGKVALAMMVLAAITEAQRILAEHGEQVVSGALVDIAEEVREAHGADPVGSVVDIVSDVFTWGGEIAARWEQRTG